jgi:hypothetical protein
MSRKMHLQKSANAGPVCYRGAIGGALRGEHLTDDYAGFTRAVIRGGACGKCQASKLFAFLNKQAAKTVEPDLSAWEPADDPDAWKAADDALIAKRKTK